MAFPKTEQELANFILKTLDETDRTRFRNADVPVYQTAALPAASKLKYTVVHVPDAPAGSKFQGSDGTVWVALG